MVGVVGVMVKSYLSFSPSGESGEQSRYGQHADDVGWQYERDQVVEGFATDDHYVSGFTDSRSLVVIVLGCDGDILKQIETSTVNDVVCSV